MAKKLGWKTTYHIGYVYIGKDNTTVASEDIFEITPWLNNDTWKELSQELDNEIKDRQTSVIITSIAKLGI